MKKRYVYYNKKSGAIIEIRSQRKQGRAYYIECANEEVKEFIIGTKNINNYFVAQDHIIEKTNAKYTGVKISADSTLTKIPYNKSTNSNLNILYHLDNSITVSLNNLRFQKVDNYYELRIVVKEKDTGKLLQEIVFDIRDLLEKSKNYKLLEYIQDIDIEFYTYKIFEDSSWVKEKEYKEIKHLKKLSKIKQTHIKDTAKSNLKIIYLVRTNSLKISLNNLRFQKVDNYYELRIVVKEKDTGKLLQEIVFDIRDLLIEEKIIPLLKHINYKNVEFYTYKIFDINTWSMEKQSYVYYNKQTGQLGDITKDKLDNDNPYIKKYHSEVQEFVTGEKGSNSYLIVYSWDTETLDILPKDNIIRLRQTSTQPVKIPYKTDVNSDLTLVYYSDNVLELSLDLTHIAPIFQSDFQSEVSFEKGTEIRIIAKEKDSGDLLKEFIIDAQDLLESGQIFLELYKHIYSDNVEFLTYDIFKSFSWHKGKVKLISPVKENIKFDIHRADTVERSDDITYHLIMTKTDKGIKVTSNIDNYKLVRFNKEIEFFVVDKYDPNILYEKFSLTEKDLKNETMLIPLKYDIKGKTILYNHKYISVLLKE